MSRSEGPGPRGVVARSSHGVTCLDTETAFLYLSGELESPVADATAVHLIDCEPCRGLVEEVSGIIGGSRELLQLALPGGLDAEPPPADLIMARGTAMATASGGHGSRASDGRSRPLTPTTTRPTARVAAAAGLLLVSALGGVLWWAESELSAAELLREARAVEASAPTMPETAVRRVLQLEERGYPDGRLLGRKSVEIWESRGEGRKARRLYGDGNALLAGEWIDRGAHVVAGGNMDPGVGPSPPARQSIDAWRWEPSVADFELLARDLPVLEVNATAAQYVLTARGTSAQGPSQVQLILSRSNLRPIEQRIVVKRQDLEHVEFRLIESDVRRVPLGSVAAALFRPDAELLPPKESAPAPAPRAGSRPPVAPKAWTKAEADGVELDVTYRLHRLERCVGGEPTITRGTRHLAVRVSVETEACMVEANRVFESLRGDERVRLTLLQSGAPPEPPPADQLGPLRGTALYSQFVPQLRGSAESSVEVQDAATEFARWLVVRSAEAMDEASAVESLVSTWSIDRLQALGVDARARWQSILRDHARTLARDADALRLHVERTLVDRPADAAPQPRVISDVADVPRAVATVVRLARAQQRIVQQLLSSDEQVANRGELMRELATTLDGLARAAAQLLEPWSLTVEVGRSREWN